MEIRIAMAKIHKYAVSESGDTFEITERPKGGLSLILADGQGSGRSAKQNSNLVVAKAVAMIGEGARDGAVARAVHDMLYAARDGKVSAELLIISADIATDTFVISRNSACPVFIWLPNEVQILSENSGPIGVRSSTKPQIDILEMKEGIMILGFSDGIWQAGRRKGVPWTVSEMTSLITTHNTDAEELTEQVLQKSLEKDGGHAGDDMTVFVMTAQPKRETRRIRRLAATFPV